MSPSLLGRLKDPDPAIRVAGCRAAASDPAATLLAPALGRALGDPDNAVVRAASDALVAIGRERGGLGEILSEALRSQDWRRRWGAVFTIARLEPPTPRLLPGLVEALGSADGDVRWAAARILVDMARLHGEVEPLLAGLARDDPRDAVRRMAIHALRSLAAAGGAGERALLSATRDREPSVRRAALTALAGSASEASLARLTEVLVADRDPASRRLAALALGALGSARGGLPAPARKALDAAAHDAVDDDLRRAALRAQQHMDAATPQEGSR